jgi:predicted PolB exonuclease-like 3'-5' exonuclease
MRKKSMKAFDIETIPNLAMIDCLPEPEANGTLKDPVKIAADIAAKKQKQIDRMALSPMYGRLCCYSVFGEHTNFFKVVNEISDSAEIELIESALNYLTIRPNDPIEICTWNGFSFDIPFLFKRAMLLKVAMPAGCPGAKYFLKKYSPSPHCDMAQELNNWSGEIMRLDDAAGIILGEKKLPHDFTKFAEMITTGNSDEIGTYCLKDSELTYRIYQAAKRYLF